MDPSVFSQRLEKKKQGPFPGGMGKGGKNEVRPRFLEDFSLPAGMGGEGLLSRPGERLLGALSKMEKGSGRKFLMAAPECG